MKVSELQGELLDMWVAKAEGNMIATHTHCGGKHYTLYFYSGDTPAVPQYSTDWEDGGPIIEREKIGTNTWHGDWGAMFTFPRKHPTEPRKDPSHHWMLGKTPLIAAMRTYVSSKFGEEVSDETI